MNNRTRPMVTITLDAEEVRMLAELGDLQSSSRSRIIGRLIRNEHGGYSPRAVYESKGRHSPPTLESMEHPALDAACPVCGAPRHVRCFEPTDPKRGATHPHTARVEAARLA